MTLELIYIGDRFYLESGSVMSSLYGIDGLRKDWGFVNDTLRAGKDVLIRQATNDELEAAQTTLDRIKK
jgi:hypothetical protein